MSDRVALAREIAARTKPRFIEIPRERGGGKVPFTEEQLTAKRGGLTAEEYRLDQVRWRDCVSVIHRGRDVARHTPRNRRGTTGAIER